MQDLIVFAALWVMPTHTGTEAFALILRWFHIIAGITWIGLLYFFNLVNVPFMKQVDAAMKPKVFQYLTLPALNWFRWSALLTVFLGFWYWGQIYVGPDAARMGVSGLSTIGLFWLIWIVSWGILFAVIKNAPSGYVLGLITAVVVVAAGWLFVNYTPVGQDDNHVLSIGVGGGLGVRISGVSSARAEAAPRIVPLRGKLPDFSILNEIARLDGALTRELGGLISAHA